MEYYKLYAYKVNNKMKYTTFLKDTKKYHNSLKKKIDNLNSFRLNCSLKSFKKYVYLWLIHIAVWQKTTQGCKAIIFQFKNK